MEKRIDNPVLSTCFSFRYFLLLMSSITIRDRPLGKIMTSCQVEKERKNIIYFLYTNTVSPICCSGTDDIQDNHRGEPQPHLQEQLGVQGRH